MERHREIKRLKRKIKSSPNPLFEAWLKEWRDEAKKNGSEKHYCFERALKSLRKYPFTLETGKECFILENFGAKLCMMLDKKLNEYRNSGEHFAAAKSKASDLDKNDFKSSRPSNEVLQSCRISGDSAEDQLEILGNDLSQKRKSCMDSPNRTLKHLRDKSNSNQSQQTKRTKEAIYLPGYRSGGYGILLTLYRKSREMTKMELEIEAQNLCDAPFKRKGNSNYTAWSSMTTLLKKGLVEKTGRPARFYLTAEGKSAAMKLQSAIESDNVNSLCGSSESQNSEEYPNFNLSITINSSFKESLCIKEMKGKKSVNENLNTDLQRVRKAIASKECELLNKRNKSPMNDSESKEETFLLLPNEFDVKLYVDNKEMENKKNAESDKIVKYLQRRNVKFEVKNLNVGDYLWVCKDRKTNRELVLPYIVERKRIDDLAGSVKDGRFHEQKFRLKNCGLHHCIYLVEKYGTDSTRLGLPLPTIQQAVSNTKVIDGFYVKVTNNNDESLCYLSVMTEFLTAIFKEKTLVSCKRVDLPMFNLSDDLISLMSFPEFNKDSGKMRKFTVRNMLVKHLLQLNGVSVERAMAIVKHFPTPKLLIEALQRSDGESIVADIKFGALGRSVGSNLAKSLQQLYTLPKLN